MKNLIKKISAAGIAAAAISAMLPMSVVAEEPTTDGVTVNFGEVVDSTIDGKYYHTYPITVTIAENATAETLHINAFEDDVNAVGYPNVEPGDTINYEVTVINKSANDYSYAVNSAKVTTLDFNPDITEGYNRVAYRSVNPAFAELFGYSKEEGDRVPFEIDSRWSACVAKIKDDGQVGAALREKGYGSEELTDEQITVEYLDDYFCTYYGVNTIDELSADQLFELYSGRFDANPDGQHADPAKKENNYEAARASYNLFYGSLYTINGYPLLDYYKDGSDAVMALNTTFGTLTADALKAEGGQKVTVSGKLAGKTGNAYQNYIFDTGLSFDLSISGETQEKTNVPGMDKKIVVDGKEVEKTAIAAGESVNYVLNSNVPDTLGNYVPYQLPIDPIKGELTDEEIKAEMSESSYTLTFHDQLDAGLNFNGDIVVNVNGKELASDLYTVTTENEDGCTFEVAMDLIKIYATEQYFTFDEIESAPKITVAYTATSNKDLTAGAYYNTSWVVYQDGQSEPDVVEVDTYGIKIFKYDQKDKKKGLEGAEFELKDAEGNLIATLTSDAEGKVTVDGLDEGEYTLQETKAPEGYIKSDTPITITLAADADSTFYALVNFANSEIPHTGGTGTAMFTTAGIALLVLAAAAYIISRRKEA